MTEAILLTHEAVRAMAEALVADDPHTDRGYDALPSDDRYWWDRVAESALRHVARQHGLPAMRPTHAGWRRPKFNSRDAVEVAVGAEFDDECPEGFEPLFRVVPDGEL